ncbi:MAG: hypothetical protein RIF41_27775 [Polyangiaceae bacterium]
MSDLLRELADELDPRLGSSDEAEPDPPTPPAPSGPVDLVTRRVVERNLRRKGYPIPTRGR